MRLYFGRRQAETRSNSNTPVHRIPSRHASRDPAGWRNALLSALLAALVIAPAAVVLTDSFQAQQPQELDATDSNAHVLPLSAGEEIDGGQIDGPFFLHEQPVPMPEDPDLILLNARQRACATELAKATGTFGGVSTFLDRTNENVGGAEELNADVEGGPASAACLALPLADLEGILSAVEGGPRAVRSYPSHPDGKASGAPQYSLVEGTIHILFPFGGPREIPLTISLFTGQDANEILVAQNTVLVRGAGAIASPLWFAANFRMTTLAMITDGSDLRLELSTDTRELSGAGMAHFIGYNGAPENHASWFRIVDGAGSYESRQEWYPHEDVVELTPDSEAAMEALTRASEGEGCVIQAGNVKVGVQTVFSSQLFLNGEEDHEADPESELLLPFLGSCHGAPSTVLSTPLNNPSAPGRLYDSNMGPAAAPAPSTAAAGCIAVGTVYLSLAANNPTSSQGVTMRPSVSVEAFTAAPMSSWQSIGSHMAWGPDGSDLAYGFGGTVDPATATATPTWHDVRFLFTTNIPINQGDQVRLELKVEFAHSGPGAYLVGYNDGHTSQFEILCPTATATISGIACNDTSEDGACDGDAGVQGMTIFIDEGNQNGQFDLGEPSQLTSMSGLYELSVATPRTFRVCQDLPVHRAATGETCTVVVLPEGFSANVDFASKAIQLSISGLACDDVDDDQECGPGDSAQAGVSIFIDEDPENQALDEGEAFHTTTSTGLYSLPVVAPLTYSVCQQLEPGRTTTILCRDVEVSFLGGGTGIDFPSVALPLPTISGTVCDDENQDGVCFEDSGIAARIFIDQDEDQTYDADTEDSVWSPAETGAYVFPVEGGAHSVCQEVPEGRVATAPICQLAIVSYESSASGVDFASRLLPEAFTISGLACDDVDEDGACSEGETGIVGLVIFVDAGSEGNGLLDEGEDQQETGATGAYSFSKFEGTYSVCQHLEGRMATGATCRMVVLADGVSATNVDFASVQIPNTPPTIESIEDQSIDEDAILGPLPIAIADADDDALTVTVSSSNEGLVPQAGLELAGTGASRALTAHPAPDQSGTTQITITVSDGEATVDQTFTLEVQPINDAPTIAIPSDQTMAEDAAGAIVLLTGIRPGPATASDEEAQGLALQAISSNPSLIPDPLVSYGTGGQCLEADAPCPSTGSLTLTPVHDKHGSALITVSLVDSGAGASPGLGTTTQFMVTVTPVNDPPTITAIPDQVLEEDTESDPVPFQVEDAESGQLALAWSSTNPALLPPAAGIMPSGDGWGWGIPEEAWGPPYAMLLKPAPDQWGEAEVTVTVTDADGGSASTTFSLTVGPVADAAAMEVPEPQDSIEEGGVLAIAAKDQATDEDSAIVFTESAAGRFVITDADGLLQAVQLVVATINGTVNFGASPEVEVTSEELDDLPDEATGNVYELTGPLADINAALAGMSFLPRNNHSGEAGFLVFFREIDADGSQAEGLLIVAATNITVNPINDPPQAVPDHYQMYQKRTLAIMEPSAGLLGNDVDDGTAVLRASIREAPPGVLGLQPAGTIQYTPPPAFNGTATFTYAVGDGQLESIGTVTITVIPDIDGDKVRDEVDNCRKVVNPEQANADHDEFGDACDATPNGPPSDKDSDGKPDATDNCKDVANPSQTDVDGDGKGDACDSNATDGPLADPDGDGKANKVDNCPTKANADQADGDGDSQGNACDSDLQDGPLADKDKDGKKNSADNCPTIANADQTDVDGDKKGNACDDDFLDLSALPKDVKARLTAEGEVVVAWNASSNPNVKAHRVWRASTPVLVGEVMMIPGIVTYTFKDAGFPGGHHEYFVEPIANLSAPKTLTESFAVQSPLRMAPCSTDDSDGDGLCDVQEAALGTDFQNEDSDGDGLTDGEEASSGQDPLTPSSNAEPNVKDARGAPGPTWSILAGLALLLAAIRRQRR